LARIKIKVQGKLVFEYQDQLRVTDMNYGNHLGNDKVLGLFHDARLKWMKSINQNELSFYGQGLIQHDAVINYKSEAFCQDDIIVKLFVDDIDSRSFDIYYQMIHLNKGNDIAIGKTGMTFFNYKDKKITNTPQLFIKDLQ
jgi:acyl-CoA thioester hydrolase